MAEYDGYRKFMRKAEFDKSVNSLHGLVRGIAIDGKIGLQEIDFLKIWLDENRIRSNMHPFTELFPKVEEALADHVLTEDERDDILWLCERLTSNEYFDEVTTGIQQLHGIMAGIAFDGEIAVDELKGLSQWLADNEYLKRCWPYDEVESLVCGVLADGKIDPEEHKQLMEFFSEFVAILDNKTIRNPVVSADKQVSGLCAVCPEIKFDGSVFCITGSSHKYSRKEFEKLVASLGGQSADSVNKQVHYLVIGADGNPCWAYACYGRKVERAVKLRREGHPIVIIHENDFHDAVEEFHG